MTTRDPERLVRTSVFLPVALRERLAEAAVSRGVSMAVVIRSSLESSVGGFRPEPNGGFLRRTTGQ